MRLSRHANAPIAAGEFLPRQASSGWGMAGRIGVIATLVAVLAASAALAALLLWLVSILLPIALGAAAIAYLAFRMQFGAPANPKLAPRFRPGQGSAGA